MDLVQYQQELLEEAVGRRRQGARLGLTTKERKSIMIQRQNENS
jgi:hypothetical protein